MDRSAAGLVDSKGCYDIIRPGFAGELGMKKVYEKPAFVRKGKLSAIVAGSPVPG
jgi:hypothetical protein